MTISAPPKPSNQYPICKRAYTLAPYLLLGAWGGLVSGGKGLRSPVSPGSLPGQIQAPLGLRHSKVQVPTSSKRLHHPRAAKYLNSESLAPNHMDNLLDGSPKSSLCWYLDPYGTWTPASGSYQAPTRMYGTVMACWAFFPGFGPLFVRTCWSIMAFRFWAMGFSVFGESSLDPRGDQNHLSRSFSLASCASRRSCRGTRPTAVNQPRLTEKGLSQLRKSKLLQLCICIYVYMYIH